MIIMRDTLSLFKHYTIYYDNKKKIIIIIL